MHERSRHSRERVGAPTVFEHLAVLQNRTGTGPDRTASWHHRVGTPRYEGKVNEANPSPDDLCLRGR